MESGGKVSNTNIHNNIKMCVALTDIRGSYCPANTAACHHWSVHAWGAVHYCGFCVAAVCFDFFIVSWRPRWGLEFGMGGLNGRVCADVGLP